jgi:hypothetical protein
MVWSASPAGLQPVLLTSARYRPPWGVPIQAVVASKALARTMAPVIGVWAVGLGVGSGVAVGVFSVPGEVPHATAVDRRPTRKSRRMMTPGVWWRGERGKIHAILEALPGLSTPNAGSGRGWSGLHLCGIYTIGPALWVPGYPLVGGL